MHRALRRRLLRLSARYVGPVCRRLGEESQEGEEGRRLCGDSLHTTRYSTLICISLLWWWQSAADFSVFSKFAFELRFLVDSAACDRTIQKAIKDIHELEGKTYSAEIAQNLQQEMCGNMAQLRTLLSEVTSTIPSKVSAWKSATSKLAKCTKATEKEIKKDLKKRKKMQKQQSSADAAADASEPEQESPAVQKKRAEEQAVREQCAAHNEWLVQTVLNAQKERELVLMQTIRSLSGLLKNSAQEVLIVCAEALQQLTSSPRTKE